MIEDKKTKTLIAENEEEAVWWEQSEQAKAYIKQIKGSIAKAQRDMKMTPREISKKFKSGAKASIKQNKMILKVQKEFLKFCQSKLKL